MDTSNLENIGDVNEVISIASKLLIVAGFFQVFDGLQAVVLGALRGMQDVNIPALIIFFSYVLLGFPTSYFLGFYTELSIVGIWIGLLTGLFSSSKKLPFHGVYRVIDYLDTLRISVSPDYLDYLFF